MKRFWIAVVGLIILVAVPSFSQTASSAFLLVTGDIPNYPQLAVAARIQGNVEVQATVKEGIVVKADATPGSNPILAGAATKTVMSWRFGAEQSGTLKITFSFELAKEEVLAPQNPEIQMKLPNLVRLIAKPVQPTKLF